MSQPGPLVPLWPRLIALLGAILMAAGGIIALAHPATLTPPNQAINAAVRIYAGYTASRNLVIAAALVAMLLVRAHAALGHLLLLIGFIQIADACLDCIEHRWPVVPGVLVLGILFLLAAARLSNQPFWKRAAYRSP